MLKKIECEDKTKYENFYSSWKAEINIDESDIDHVFQSIYTTILTNMQKIFGKGLCWIFDSVIDHTISISKYNPLAGSSYIEPILRKLLDGRKDGRTEGQTDPNSRDPSGHSQGFNIVMSGLVLNIANI